MKLGVNPDIIAHGKVVIDIAENIQRDMAKVEADVERGLRRLERKEAELKLSVDDRAFVNGLRRAQAQAFKAEQDMASASDARERKNAKARLARARKDVNVLSAQNTKLYNKAVQLDEDRSALQQKLSNKRVEGERKLTRAIEGEEKKRAAAEERRRVASRRSESKAAQDSIASAVKVTKAMEAQEEKRRKDANRVQTRSVNDSIRLAVKSANDRQKIEQRSHAAINRQRQQALRQQAQDMEQAAQLHARYIELMEKRQSVALKRSKLFTTSNERIRLDVDLRHVDQQAAQVRARLEAIDEPPVDIDLEIDDRGSKALSKWAHLISDTSVRMGPFTTSIGGATRVLALFGPVITGVAGALGALAGVVGSGAFGALGTLTGGMLGFGAALGGVGLLVPSLLRDFKHLTSLQDTYHKRLLELGPNAEKTQTALEKYNHALGAVAPTTHDAFMAIDKLQDRWRGLRKEVRPDFYDALGASIQMVNKNFSMFANESIESFGIVTDGWQSLMQGLQSDEAISNFQTLSDNAQESLPAFGRGLASLGKVIVRIGVNFSRYLPSLAKGFEDWAGGMESVTDDTDKLTSMVDQNVESMRSLGHFAQATTGFLMAFFGRGVEPGIGLVDRMTQGIEGWTEAIQRDPSGLDNFFSGSVETTEDLWEAIVPLAKLFMEWATIMRPFTTAMLAATEVISGVVEAVASFGPIRNFVTVAFGVFLAGSLVGKIMAVVGAMKALAASTTAVGTANAGARIADMATGGGLGFGARQQRRAGGGRGASGRAVPKRGPGGSVPVSPTVVTSGLTSPAGKAAGTKAVRGFFGSAIKGAGLLGLGVMASDILMKGIATAGVRGSAESTIRGVGQDIMSTLSFGMVDGAEEASGKAGRAAVAALRKNMNDSLRGKLVDNGIFKSIYGEDLTGEQRKFLERFRGSLQEAAAIARDFNMPIMRADVKVDADPRDFKTLRRNFNRLKNGLISNVTEMRSVSDQNIRAIAKTLGTQSNAGKRAVIENMDLTARSIGRSMKNGSTSAKDGMRAIRQTFTTNSRAAKETTGTNFQLAKRAIQQAVRDGVVSSKRGTREIKRLWVENLEMYGLSQRQAKNIAKTGDPDANKGREGGAFRARGGLVNVGTPGKRARDNVPAMLNGQPSIVAEGEQVAVFNRHQQREMNSMVPGGLSGFFNKNKKPHYAAQGGIVGKYAGGGIVPVPGFPGESAASSVIGMITSIARRFALTLTDAFGQGHESPGHTVTGTAADFAGPDSNMDAAVRFLVSKGFLVGYDGRFGSQDWPGHGPAAGQGGSNAHLHVELGGAGAGIDPIEIPRQMISGIGGMAGGAAQAMLDSVLGAANFNLEQVASSMLAPVGGGSGVAAGAATRAQMVGWARQALTVTRNLGHGGPTPGNIAKILELAMKESSWVTDSINNWDVNAAAGNPSGGLMHVTIDKVGGSRAALFDPVTNMIASIVYQMSRYKGLITHSPYAQGGIATDAKTSKKGGRVNSPRLLVGEEPVGETVISHNPSYRKSNIGYLEQAAKALGVPMARKGKGNKNATKNKPGYRKPAALKKNKKIIKTGGDPDNFPAVKKYGQLQDQETDVSRRISIAESQFQEPDTFLKVTGTDPVTGDPIYQVDDKVVFEYAWGLNKIKQLYEQLLDPKTGVLAQMKRAAEESFRVIRNYIDRRNHNIGQIDNDIDRQQKLAKSKNSGTRTKAQDRLAKLRDDRRDEVQDRQDARDTRDSIKDDQHDAAFRRQEYNVPYGETVQDWKAVGGGGAAELKEEQDKAAEDKGSTAETGPTMQMQVLSADTERANILREFGGNVNQSVAGISGASSGLQTNLAGGLGSAAVTAGLTTGTPVLGGGGGSTMARVGAAMTGGMTAGTMFGSTSGGTAGTGTAAATTGDRSVTINNTFAAPPEDPMTWTKGVMFEAQAAI